MYKIPCDVTTRKHFRIVANIIMAGMIVSTIGIAISILLLVNYFMGVHIFPFSEVIDPPYFGVVCMVTLSMFIGLAVSLHKIREKTCKSMELPLI